MLTAAPVIRHAAPADRAALAELLARAFRHDPILNWVLPDPAARERHGPAFFDWSLGRLLPQGSTWTTDGLGGAALWAEPGRWRETAREGLQLTLRLGPALGRRAPLVMRGMRSLEDHHPRTRHLYLAVLGVDPDHQGQGLGSALMAPGLERCDADGLPAYLESSNPANVPLYERHGFVVTGTHHLPDGPPFFTMWRDPR